MTLDSLPGFNQLSQPDQIAVLKVNWFTTSVLFKFSYVSNWGTLYKATTPGDARIAIRLKGHAGVACAGKPHS